MGWVQISPLFHEDDQDDQVLIDHLAWVVAKARMRSFYGDGVPGDGLRKFKCAISAISAEGWNEKRASGPVAPGDGCPD